MRRAAALPNLIYAVKEAARRYELEAGLSFPLDPKRPEWYQTFPMG